MGYTKDQYEAMRRILEYYQVPLEVAGNPFAQEIAQLRDAVALFDRPPVNVPEATVTVSFDGVPQQFLGNEEMAVSMDVIRMIATRDFDGLFAYGDGESSKIGKDTNGSLYALDSYGVLQRLPDAAKQVIG